MQICACLMRKVTYFCFIKTVLIMLPVRILIVDYTRALVKRKSEAVCKSCPRYDSKFNEASKTQYRIEVHPRPKSSSGPDQGRGEPPPRSNGKLDG